MRGDTYVPRTPTTGVLYGVVRAHLAAFVATLDARTDGSGLPPFVRAEFDKFLRCGVLAHGFARVRCGACGFERLLPFSCKGRGFCPSCGGRLTVCGPRTKRSHLSLVTGLVQCAKPAAHWLPVERLATKNECLPSCSTGVAPNGEA